MPLISVYITSYNHKDWLKQAIESVLAQTLKPSQIIVVDDASTDGSQDLITSYINRYPDLIEPIFHQQNTGIASVRADALERVTGDFVTYLDGDDLYMPQKLEKEYLAISNDPDVDMVFSNYAFVESDLNKVIWVWADDEKPPVGNVFHRAFTRQYPRKNLFRMEMVNYRKFKSIGFHDSQLTTFEDFDAKIRLTKELRVAFVDEVLSYYRFHHSGLAQRYNEHLKNLEYIYYKNERLLGDLPLKEKRAASLLYWKYCINTAKIYRNKISVVDTPIKFLKAEMNILRFWTKFWKVRVQ